MGSGYSAWTLLGVRCCKVQGAVPLQPALLCRVGRLLYCSAVVGVCSIRLDTLLCQSALVRTQLAWRETRALPVTNSLCLFLLKSKLFHLLEANAFKYQNPRSRYLKKDADDLLWLVRDSEESFYFKQLGTPQSTIPNVFASEKK